MELPPFPFGEVFQPLHLLVLTTLPTQVPLVSMGHRSSSWVRFGYERWNIVSGLHTSKHAMLRRMPLTPHTVAQVWPFWAIFLFVKERTIRRTI